MRDVVDDDWLQPLVGSCWNSFSSVFVPYVPSLQPLVGSCWNKELAAVLQGRPPASTPRGVLLEPKGR